MKLYFTYLLQRHVFAIKTAFETTTSPHIIMMMETEIERLSMAARDFIPQKYTPAYIR